MRKSVNGFGAESYSRPASEGGPSDRVTGSGVPSNRVTGSGVPSNRVTGSGVPGRVSQPGRMSQPGRTSRPGTGYGGGSRKGKGTAEKVEALNKEILTKVYDTFMRADADGNGRLTPEEFVNAFMGVLQTEDGSGPEALGKLFMRIDSNSDGTIDWDEFSSFMLLESQGSASIRELESFISLAAPVAVPVPDSLLHTDVITHIEHIQVTNGADRYVTCSKDGSVKIWNCKDMKHLKTLYPGGSSWTTCAKWMPHSHKLAVSSFSRSMKIYDMTTYEQCGQIQEIDNAPLAMDCWTAPRSRDSDLVVFGDGGGFVRLYQLKLNPLEEKNSPDRYQSFQKWKHQYHTDWITQVQYVDNMNFILAASLDKLISICDAEERVPLKVLEGHTKGVNTIDWSSIYKLVCSGAQDRRIILWNPFSQKPLATLMGHTGSVMKVVVNDRDNQIISLGADKMVKIWDIRNHRCIQTVADKEFYKGEDTLYSMCYDNRRKQVATGNRGIKTWKQTVTTSTSAGHRDPVMKVLYNPLFHEAVSGDQGGTVSVWSIPTGKLRFRFYNAHAEDRITALNFDSAWRRLITGSERGESKVWNFSSGACLARLHPAPDGEEVTAVLGVHAALMRHFLVAGWDRKITFYEDEAEKEIHPGRSMSGHKADILDMVCIEGLPIVATCDDDGEIWVWNIESGSAKRRMWYEGKNKLPPNERAVECIRFLHGPDLRAVLLSVGADRFLRFWDTFTGECYMEVFTAHKMGETVAALAVEPTNSRIATGDSGGFIKVWDMSTFELSKSSSTSRGSLGMPSRQSGTSASGVVEELAVWRAHHQNITALDWAPSKHGLFLVSSSLDKTIHLWDMNGAHVGTFGCSLWNWSSPSSWRSQSVAELEGQDAFDMGEHGPSRKHPHVVDAEMSHATPKLAKQYSCFRSPAGEEETISERPSTQPHSVSTSHHITFSHSASLSRPGTAPEGVMRVLQASHKQRLSRVLSSRRAEKESARAQIARLESMGRPLLGSPVGSSSMASSIAATPTGGLLSRRGFGQPSFGGTSHASFLAIDEDNDDQAVAEISSSDHSSDEDVPGALWLEDFNAARSKVDAGPSNSKKKMSYYSQSKFRMSGKPEFTAPGRKREGSVAHLIPKMPERTTVLR